MHNLKVLLTTMGYGFGALFVLAGLTGSASAVALGATRHLSTTAVRYATTHGGR
jgi:hypothetical protein